MVLGRTKRGPRAIEEFERSNPGAGDEEAGDA